jgi:hypothetical protein
VDICDVDHRPGRHRDKGVRADDEFKADTR